MPYKACYNCELLFEVDQAAAEMSCTECGAALVNYTPDASELDQLHDEATEGETIMLAADQVASPVSSGVVATMAIEGLAAKLRAAAEKGEGADALLPPRRVEPPMMKQPKTEPLRITDPSPRSVSPITPKPATPQPVTPQPATPK
ncbi:MAG: putative nucleic acid-binding Zn-ribbon protein, partial [Bradymonadia bacterium]